MRWLYAIIGAVWGGLLGILGSFLIYAAGHFMFSFLYNQPPLPGWVETIIGIFALLAFVLVFLSSLAAGWRIGTIIDLDPKADKVKARERALNLFLAAILVNAVVVGGLGYYAQNHAAQKYADDIMAIQQQDRPAPTTAPGNDKGGNFAATLHKITAVDANDPGSDIRFINVNVTLAGKRAGEYRLEATISDRVHNAALLRLHKNFIIAPGTQTVRLDIDRDQVHDAYLQKVLGGDTGGQQMDIIGDFRLELELVPVLSATEREKLPDYLVKSLSLGKSELIGSREVSLRLGLKFQ